MPRVAVDTTGRNETKADQSWDTEFFYFSYAITNIRFSKIINTAVHTV